MYCVEINKVRMVFNGNETYYAGEKLSDQDMVNRNNVMLLKLKNISNGNYFTAYIIDEIEQYLKGNEQDYEHFFFILEVVSEITDKKNVTLNVPLLIEYMMKDIESFKNAYEEAESISSFLSEVMVDVEMFL